jgi:hypothetical protein
LCDEGLAPNLALSYASTAGKVRVEMDRN